MRRTVVLTLSVLIPTLCLSISASADYIFWNVSQTAGASNAGTVAISPGPTTMVAWEEASREVWSRALVGQKWQEPTYHGLGLAPAMAWGRIGVVLAYASGSQIIIIEGNGGSWGTPFVIDEPAAVRSPDVWCGDEAGMDAAYVVWQMTSGEVRFSLRTESGWSPPETVSVTDVAFEWGEPHVRPTQTVEDGIVPRVYYFDWGMLKYAQRENGVWSTPTTIHTVLAAGTRMDVAVATDFRHKILTLAPQPT